MTSDICTRLLDLIHIPKQIIELKHYKVGTLCSRSLINIRLELRLRLRRLISRTSYCQLLLIDFSSCHLKESDHHGVDLSCINCATAVAVEHVEHPGELVLGGAEGGGVDRQHVLLEVHAPTVVFVKHPGSRTILKKLINLKSKVFVHLKRASERNSALSPSACNQKLKIKNPRK